MWWPILAPFAYLVGLFREAFQVDNSPADIDGDGDW